MLDSETKGRIDSARDILVGKVPDPKSQVEQITIALIYKFMDDMDRQSEELGGKATFFTGDFKKHRWASLLDKRLGGHERLILYAEGIEKMNVNKNIPQLFRDIFKGVFLPYRDPETLNLFLKEINGFSYDHSERLGDAFEYLLSVLGTQGDAGQFRTPRHIIDFIVAVVDPKKNETVLDPACGTAGFLISAFKHILDCGSRIEDCGLKKDQISNPKSTIPNALTPDERARLMTNFRGYDIAPDMVRLSRANLYLHGFPNPVIHEYDTLASEERWDERCDVIMANPPFMSPKGGIRPHNRFSIKAKRSEVLFVDYIAEHLNPSGRAGIIVPEGIIFQSQNAYRQLRKILVENYLWAVVSLPAGVFNPYAGVKTSVLFLDRNLAKRADEVLFVKVENDGFGLGAQRRPNGKNDLPEALKILDSYKMAQKTQESKMALTVSRKRLLESGDVNLSGDRYRTTAVVQGKWPMVKLGEVCELVGGGTPSKTEKRFWQNGTVKWLSAKHISDKGAVVGYELITHEAVAESATSIVPANATVFITRVSVGKCTLISEPFAINQDLTGVIVRDRAKILPEYVYVVLRSLALRIESDAQGLGVKGVTRQYMADIAIPLPPLEVQKEIVAEIEGCQKVINGARSVLDNYRPHITIHPDWPMVELTEVADLQAGFASGKSSVTEDGVPHIRPMNITDAGLFTWEGLKRISAEEFAGNEEKNLRRGDVLFNNTNSVELVGKTCLIPEDIDGGYSNHMTRLRSDANKVVPHYLALVLHGRWRTGYFGELATRWIGQAGVNAKTLATVKIPLPPLATQQAIVTEIEAEQALVAANRELIARFEKKIQATLARVWGEKSESE